MSIPKDKEKNRQYGFVTYKYQSSVPYALAVFAGTKLFNRDLRLNNRCVNKNNNNIGNNQTRGLVDYASDFANIPSLVWPNIPKTHQIPLQKPFGNAALSGSNGLDMNKGLVLNQKNNMKPTTYDYSSAMLSSGNSLGSNSMGNDNDTHKHQSKNMHENRSRKQNLEQNSNSHDRRNQAKDQGRYDQRGGHSRNHGSDRN